MEKMNLKQAVILAGGLGTRLKPLTNDRPKPMVLVDNRPFLEHLIELLKYNGIKDVVLLLGYLPEKVTEYFGDGSRFGVKITYSVTPVDDETGTRIKKARKLLDKEFLLMYCDNYWPLDLKKLKAFHDSKKVPATVTVYSNKDSRTKNNVLVTENGLVKKYDKARVEQNLNGVELGFFILSDEVIDLIPADTNSAFEKTVLPRLVAESKLAGFFTDHPYYSIGDTDRLKKTEQFLKPRKIVILDRDGVINKKAPKADYVKNWSEFEFLPKAVDALKILAQNGYEIFFVSNQAGVARGMMTKNDLDSIHYALVESLAKQNIVIRDAIYCTHGWDEGCDCRKPKAGMFFELARKHLINLSRAYFIGDDARDMEAGTIAGCKTFLVSKDKNFFSIVKEII